jgi:hypothetical protein
MKSTPALWSARTGSASLLRVFHGNLKFVERLAIQHRAGALNARPRSCARIDRVSPFIDFTKQPAHIAYASHAVCKESGMGTGLGIAEVDVHIPQTRNDEQAAPVKHSRAAWNHV